MAAYSLGREFMTDWLRLYPPTGEKLGYLFSQKGWGLDEADS